MRAALIRISPLAVIERFPNWPISRSLRIPGVGDVHGAKIGHEVSGYRLIEEVKAGAQPHEYVTLDSETFSFDGNVTVTATRTWTPLPLAKVKEDLRRRIDKVAEFERLKYITAGTGQALEYESVKRELIAYALDASPTVAKYPMLAAGIGVDGADLAEVVQAVNAREAQWGTISAAIRGVRLKAKFDVGRAVTVAAAVAVWEAIAWPS